MSILGTTGLGEEESGGSESLYAASLGRISGKLLADNLIRHGIDLAFRNTLNDPELLYLKVGDPIEGNASTNDSIADPQYSILTEPPYDDGDPNWGSGSAGRGIGINLNNPLYELHVNLDIKTLNLIATSSAVIDDLILEAPRTFTTTSSSINIMPDQNNPIVYFDSFGTIDDLDSPILIFNENTIQSFNNQNIIFDASGTGKIELQANTAITPTDVNEPTLSVNGSINISGNLSTAKNLIIGDNIFQDTVTINADLTQDINPALPNLKLGDVNFRWAEAHIERWENIGTIRPESANIGSNLFLGGEGNSLLPKISGSDLVLSSGTGLLNIEKLSFFDDIITSLMQQPNIDPIKTAAGILSAADGDSNAALFNTTVIGVEYFLGGGQTVRTERTSLLGDVRNDLDNPGVLDQQDADKILEIYNNLGGTTNEQLWYHNVIKPSILSNPTEYEKWGDENINLSDTPFTVQSSGIGYVQFTGTSAMVIPAGTSAERQYLGVGDTRWNTDLNLLECFDGERYIVATGPGAVVTNDLMIDLAITRALFLG
jgi:hypothetical protein